MADIVIVLHDLRGGGAEKMMVRLANQLQEEGDTITMVLVASGGENKAFLSQQVRLIELQCKRTLYAFSPLRKMLKQLEPDAILSALTHINVITALCCASLGRLQKLWVSERNAFSLDKNVNTNSIMKAAYRIAPWLYRLLPNPVICVSKGVAQDLVEHAHVLPSHTVIAPNPVITSQTRDAGKAAPQHPWLKERSKPVVIAVGRLAPQKGFDLLIDVFSQVLKTIDARLIILGEGQSRETLQAQITSLNIDYAVSMPGYCENPIAEIAAAQVFVLSSRFEGSPNVLVEAMSVNTPVVAFDCPFGARDILADGKIPDLVEYLDTEEMLVRIVNRLEFPANNNFAAAYASQIEKYSAAQSANVYRHHLLGG